MKYAKTKCRDCNATVSIRRDTLTAYKKTGRHPLCDECRVKVYRANNQITVTGVCDKCGEEYEASKVNYEHKRSNDLACYCKPCAHKITGKAVRAANFSRWSIKNLENQSAKDAMNRYDAPCGRIIINVPWYKNTRHDGDCFMCNWAGKPEYEHCLSVADERDWTGWTIKKEVAHGQR